MMGHLPSCRLTIKGQIGSIKKQKTKRYLLTAMNLSILRPIYTDFTFKQKQLMFYLHGIINVNYLANIKVS